jgi:NAD(P)-dependent dehydrogenase (short-subunit alcohol dehydrogenase family)
MSLAVITGASRGLGKALATALAERRWSLVVDARTTAELEVVANEFVSKGAGHVRAISGSVRDADHRERVKQEVDRLGGDLDLLVNNASMLGPSPQPSLAEYPVDVLREVYEINVLAPLALTQLLLPGLRRSRGTVVNITSDAAVEPYAGWGGYGSSKAALDQVSAILDVEEPGVPVYAFDPGDMRTRMHQEAFPGEDISDRPEPESVLPALLFLLAEHRPSGRYRATDLQPAADVA